jgi:RHS repeat-associated protein
VLDFGYNFSLGSADNGNVTAITNNRDITRSQNFTYDALNRIATAQTQTASVAIPNSHCWGLTFGYDAWGNLLSSFTTGPAGCSEPLPLNVSATPSNQISGYCYDAAGNMLDPGACPTAPNPHAYAYNVENQLVSAAGVSYAYDGDGKRVQKSSGKLYWYGMGSDPLDETDLAGNTNNSGFNEYVFFGGKRIARRDSSNNVSYYFADHLGTARVSTNSSGTICYDADFYPFGGERIITDSCDSAYKFTGKERDSESGLDDFEARYYSSALGRFTIPDWAASATAVPYADFGDPQSLNLYSYVRNNPLLKTDPDGHDCCDFWQVVNFVGGLINAYGSDNLAGAGRQQQPTTEGKIGAAVGDTAAAVQGVVEVVGGAGGEVGGVALDATGVGAIVGVPVNVASAGLIVHGAATATVATGHLGAAAGEAIKNTLNAPVESRAGDFKASTRENAIKDNATANGGANKCENCGQEVTRTQNQKGQAPPGNQLQVHHDPPIKDGGGQNSKPVVLCRDCHVKEHQQ